MQIRYARIFTESITPGLMKPTSVKLCTGMRDDQRQTRAHEEALFCSGWGTAAHILAAGVGLHLLRKQSVDCTFFAGFKESLRSTGLW